MDFAGLASGGVQHAMIVSLWVVIGIVVLCTAIVPLLPKKAAGSTPDPLASDGTLGRTIRLLPRALPRGH
ncbi:MAG: hypothetical protein ACYDDU_18085 [Dermatophilaceae bacterium]